MHKSTTILIVALAVALAAGPQALAQTADQSTTLTAQKKNVAPVRSAPVRTAAPVRSAPVRTAPHNVTVKSHTVSKPVATTHTSKPVVSKTTTKPVMTKTTTKPVTTKTTGKTTTKPTVTTTTKPTKPTLTTTTKPTKPTVTTTTSKPGLKQGPGKKTLTQGPGKTKGTVGSGPGFKKGTNKQITTGPGKLRDRTVRTDRGNAGRFRDQRRVVINRERRRIFVNNRWRTLVPLVALGTLVIGAETLYADGYLPVPEPVCEGYAEDGSRLRWMAVPTEDGGSEFQCVAYSPQRNRTITEIELPASPVMQPPSPPETMGAAPASPPPVATPAPGPVPATGCELLIYSETNFKGTSSPVDEDQPALGDEGWQNEIASIEIKSGTWDFYSDENYGGDVMRLGAGSYPTLDPKWSKHIGSFQCSAPGK